MLATHEAALSAVAVAVAAVALAVGVSGRGCSGQDGPAAAVHAFLAAAARGDRPAVRGLLGPRTLDRLEGDAARAGQLVGGGRRFVPDDLVGLGPVGHRDGTAVRVELVEQHGAHAIVELTDDDGVNRRLELVRIDAGWRIELGAPPPGEA